MVKPLGPPQRPPVDTNRLDSKSPAPAPQPGSAPPASTVSVGFSGDGFSITGNLNFKVEVNRDLVLDILKRSPDLAMQLAKHLGPQVVELLTKAGASATDGTINRTGLMASKLGEQIGRFGGEDQGLIMGAATAPVRLMGSMLNGLGAAIMGSQNGARA